MSKILLIEPDKEQAEAFTDWLKDAGYEVKAAATAEEALPILSAELAGVIIDIDSPDEVIAFHEAIKKDAHLLNIPVFTIIFRTRVKEIALLLGAGIDNLLFKPFDAEIFTKQLEISAKESESKKKGKKLINQNYLNLMIRLTGESGRDNFFILAPAIFNELILAKVKSILGGPVVDQIIKRADEMIGMDYPFMKEVKYRDSRIFMEGVDRASGGVPPEKLVLAFRDYVYAFLHMMQALTSDILMERGGA